MALDTLTLMRHAKSDWKNADLSDHDRPLNDRGHRDAPEMAKRLQTLDSIPELILCSTATRAANTATHLLRLFNSAEIEISYKKELYLASPDTMLRVLEGTSDAIRHVMIIAHNPGLENLSAMLSASRSDTLQTAAIRQFSCLQLTDLRNVVKKEQLAPNHVELLYSDYPKQKTA